MLPYYSKKKVFFLKFNAKKGGKTISPLPQFLKVGRAIAPSSFALEVFKLVYILR
jgi:hypothetical protein